MATKKTTPAATVSAKPTRQYRDFTGTVVSAAMNKTITARVDVMKRHPKYNKPYRVTTKFHIHDEKGIAKVGDVVEFRECRPLSKTKRWYLLSVVKQATA